MDQQQHPERVLSGKEQIMLDKTVKSRHDYQSVLSRQALP